MVAGGVGANVEVLGDLLIGVHVDDELKDLTFAVGEDAELGVELFFARELGEVGVTELGREEFLVIADGLDGFDAGANFFGFEEITIDALFDGLLEDLDIGVCGEDEDLHMGKADADAREDFEAVEVGHAEVEHQEIALLLFERGQEFLSGA